MRKKRFKTYSCAEGGCPVESTLEIIGGKWKGLVLFQLSLGTRRFGELKRTLTGVTQRTLTKQLRELEADGLVNRLVHPIIPPHVDYSLTSRGESLKPVLMELKRWGEKHALK